MVQSKTRILVIDDDRLTRTMLCDIFAGRCEVLSAPDGPQALATLGREEVDVVLCDHLMPGVTGVEVLRQTMALQPRAVRILVTASEDIKDIRDAVNLARVHRVIVKPAHPVEVEGIVEGALRERTLEEENRRLVAELKQALDEVQKREAELEHELRVRTDELREVMAQFLKAR
jgi:response regulator RpfG family c-di-GMP phosphodiesterase